jgi:hypothetical protein
MVNDSGLPVQSRRPRFGRIPCAYLAGDSRFDRPIVVVIDRAEVDEWVSTHVRTAGPIEPFLERPWATVLRVPLIGGAVAWFKACAPIQAFEPRLTMQLFRRWPDRMPAVLAHDEERGWLLLADAGTSLGDHGNPPSAWLRALPLYAELQRGEAGHAEDHLGHRVPDLRLPVLPSRFDDLLRHRLPIADDEVRRLRAFQPRFEELCTELAAAGLPATVQHDDLHLANVYVDGAEMRFLDWGDASIAHPFGSLVVTFRFLEQTSGLGPGDPWFARLRDAYLEPWGRGLESAFELGLRVGTFAHAAAWIRQRDALPQAALADFDRAFRIVLGRAVARTIA